MRWRGGIPPLRRGGRRRLPPFFDKGFQHLPHAVGLEVADDSARRRLARLPFHPVGQELLRLRRRAGGHIGRLGGVAGYSGTPLPKKLGIKEGSSVVLLGAPEAFGFDTDEMPDGVEVKQRAGPADVVLFFTKSRAELAKRIDALGRNVFP